MTTQTGFIEAPSWICVLSPPVREWLLTFPEDVLGDPILWQVLTNRIGERCDTLMLVGIVFEVRSRRAKLECALTNDRVVPEH